MPLPVPVPPIRPTRRTFLIALGALGGVAVAGIAMTGGQAPIIPPGLAKKTPSPATVTPGVAVNTTTPTLAPVSTLTPVATDTPVPTSTALYGYGTALYGDNFYGMTSQSQPTSTATPVPLATPTPALITAVTDTNPMVTSHNVTLSRLTPATSYWYRAHSKDAASNEAVSNTLQFVTRGVAA